MKAREKKELGKSLWAGKEGRGKDSSRKGKLNPRGRGVRKKTLGAPKKRGKKIAFIKKVVGGKEGLKFL